MNHDSAIRDRNISTIFTDWKQTGNICGRYDKVRVFTNFYAVGYVNNDVFTEKGVALHLEPPCRLMTFSYRFSGIFRVQSPLYSDKSDHRRTACHRSSYVHNHHVYNRSVIQDTDERRVETQRVALTYDNVATIKFHGIDACRHFSFGNCRNGQLTSD